MRLTTRQVADQLGVARDTVTGWITRGVRTPAGRLRLPAIKVGVWLVLESDLVEWLQALNPEVQLALAEEDAARVKRARAAAKRMGWETG